MEINILHYLPENTKIKLDKILIDKLFYGRSLTRWSRFLGISLKNLSRYKNGSRAVPLDLFNRLVALLNLNLIDFQNNIQLKINSTGNYIKLGPIIEIDEKWVYVSELIKGDGHIPSKFHYLVLVNNNKVLIDYVKDFFISLGLDKKHLFIYKKDDVNFLIIRSYLLAYLFNKILEVPVGKKNEINISDFVMKNRSFGIAAIRGAFDAEGSVNFIGSRSITISSQSLIWINKLQKILDILKIKSKIYKEEKSRSRPIYRLTIHHIINLKRFYRIIKPLHSKRQDKLRKIITEFNKNPSRIFHKKILLSIQSGNYRRSDIARDINKSLILVSNNIAYLKEKGFITPFEKNYTNIGCYFKYKMTDSGIKYLEEGESYYF
ncbi:hypothetical protein J4218_04225 [Candidatus Pacearchaeota archaeon]|nr:hypothetical protein [Candidatus Pacearchaeota archaeon]